MLLNKSPSVFCVLWRGGQLPCVTRCQCPVADRAGESRSGSTDCTHVCVCTFQKTIVRFVIAGSRPRHIDMADVARDEQVVVTPGYLSRMIRENASDKVRIVFSSETNAGTTSQYAEPSQTLRKFDCDINAGEKSFFVQNAFFSLWTLAKICIVLAFVLWEVAKFNSCYIEKSDLIRRDIGAEKQEVCTDNFKVARFGHRFGEGCRAARQSVEEGLIHSTYECFISKHNFYKVLSFDNMYTNAFLAIALFFMLSLIKDYWVQTQTAKMNIAMIEKFNAQEYRRFVKNRNADATKNE